MQLTFGATIQVLILTTGIYVVLSFLRRTRGSGLVRGLAVTLLVGVFGLWLVSEALGLEELWHIVQSVGPYLVIILAILFQAELRRGIVQLGENPLLGKLLKARRQEVLTEIAQAVATMANKRQGALIAFERKIPLDAFIEGAVRVDAEVNRFLLDSIFHHGSALHDGAVVVRGDRIEAATALFPLTENVEISKSTGTRHRAALGLTEETDAVTVAVSEETGSIAICKGGKMHKKVPASQLEELLRESIGSDDANVSSSDAQVGAREWLGSLVTEHVGQKVGAFAIATGLFWYAYQDIRATQTIPLEVVRASEVEPSAGRLFIVLPDPQFHLAEPQDTSMFDVEVTGTRKQLEPLSGGRLGGVLQLGSEVAAREGPFPLDEVEWWAGGSYIEGLEVRWKTVEPQLHIEQFGEERFTLGPEHVDVDTELLDKRYRARTDTLRIQPASVEIVGPFGSMALLGTDELPLRLDPIELHEDDANDRVENLGLHDDLEARGFSLKGRSAVEVLLEIAPAEVDLGTIEKEISLSWLSPEGADGLERWAPPVQDAVFSVRTAGILLEADPNSAAWIEQAAIVRQFVQDELSVFVDVSEVAHEESGRQAQVRWFLRTDWRAGLPAEMGTEDERALLEVELESEPQLLLIPR